jgi:DNA-binding NarL/FixJ family response regulator
MAKARILLVDDHELFREGVALVINKQPDMEVVGQADDGLEALTMAHDLRPDLIIMDINMPLSNGLEATELIHNSVPESIIIMLTAHEEDEKLFTAIKAGAQGYILKSSPSAGLIGGIRGALNGESSVPRKLARQFLAEFSKLSKRSDNPSSNSEETLPVLTSREREILDAWQAARRIRKLRPS